MHKSKELLMKSLQKGLNHYLTDQTAYLHVDGVPSDVRVDMDFHDSEIFVVIGKDEFTITVTRETQK